MSPVLSLLTCVFYLFELEPYQLEVPQVVSGVVVHFGSGLPVEGAEVELKWSARPALVDRMKPLAKTGTDVDGRFAAGVSLAPVSSIIARSPPFGWASGSEPEYIGFARPGWNLASSVEVRVRPNLSIGYRTWDGPKGDIERLRRVITDLLADHVPGTPPPRLSPRQHVAAGRLSESDLAFLIENRKRFVGPRDVGTPAEPETISHPPYGQLRLSWSGLDLDYGTEDSELSFLTWGETARRNGWSAKEVREFLALFCAAARGRCPLEE